MVIKSNIKIISIENAQNDSENAIIYTHNAEDNKLIISVKYQNKNRVACLYDTSIDVIKNTENNEIIEVDNEKMSFVSADFSDEIAYIEEENVALFKANSNIKIIGVENQIENNFKIEDIIKDIYVQDDILAVNAGTELYFLDANANLIKKYVGNREITNVILSKEVGIIVYKDKVIIIKL